ncbi:MAG: acetyl-CoA carboxylase biotin carboxyl carrier protein [Deltaproteobacteria bacterium]|nr:acetyl-CoA carboxylase biotin carboxyl carrier protein [Deltaproteobacteria bacterium]MCL5793010.1 acetyl-CoA carboxylase biotin carboxyl carrier protein [Deltaproteobacteria bacterium]
MDTNSIKELLAIIEEKKDIIEIEYSKGDEKIRITRQLVKAAGPSTERFQKKGLAEEQTMLQKTEQDVHSLTINSPFVGTFYSAPSPSDKPFVEIGDIVKKGQTIGIVEAMKLMNEIEADADGKIVQVLKKDGEAVEFGEPIFIIEPQG